MTASLISVSNLSILGNINLNSAEFPSEGHVTVRYWHEETHRGPRPKFKKKALQVINTQYTMHDTFSPLSNYTDQINKSVMGGARSTRDEKGI